ncbi:phosphate signaling complex protein PhoU [Facklamia sp. DSM 111018]|uniref:Phosphate-specific transport system accessory protein PhoU n=1 Tax=Facklamia lactis TaxID=2749967 RepID=A0ABS0LR56_9LACT|nr:phosphate signaling complex protein PhoU [Facklamia lactis]MBG9980744.1 phosphate signaling complex protein PhoU [Facklamia lactis]MBG9986558.1 phosphate signaling complex protein PhoU [Facklamia lactis]
MRQLYILELEGLVDKVDQLASFVQTAISQAMQAVNESNVDLANKVVEANEAINQYAAEIEKESYRIVALQQPVAGDLRLVFAIMHIGVEMKRMGEHASVIAKKVIRNKADITASLDLIEVLNEMADQVLAMFNQVIELIHESDLERTGETALMDPKVDELLNYVYQTATQRMIEDEESVQAGIHIIDVATSLERIGDYITNICEHLVYLETGSMMRLN